MPARTSDHQDKKRNLPSIALASLVALLAVGCPEPDIRLVDAGTPDAEALDAGEDAGSDAGSDDAGMDDAGMDDAGIDDAGIDDAGIDDAGIDDAGADGGADAGDDGGSDAGLDGGAAEPNVMFVTTAAPVIGDLGGRAGADALCNARAANGGLPAVGSYVAWLSVTGEGAAERLVGSRGWVRPDGMPFVDTVEDLLRGAVFYPPRITEQGVANSVTTAATGTLRDGSVGDTCGDWTSTSGTTQHGDPRDGSELWTHEFAPSCGATAHLYCFGTGRVATVEAPAPVGRRAFVTRGGVFGNAGIAAMDALCASEATTAGLSGTFVALVADDGTLLTDRVAAGAAWSRSDGVLVGTHAQLLAGDLVAPANVTADGLDPVLEGVWWGTPAVATPGAAETTCGGWTQTSGNGRLGPPGSSQLVQGGAFSACASSFLRVACFEQ